jgi:CP family cyanate transporter-like MFS transporter
VTPPTTTRWSGLAGRRLVLLAIVVSALNLRSAVTSLSPLLHLIGTDLGFGAGTIGVIGSLPPACFALFGAITPIVVRRFGLEATATITMLITTVGLVVRAFADSPAALVALSMVALAGMGIAGVVIPPLVRKYFSDRLALVSSLYLIALHLGALVPPLVAVSLATSAGWRPATALWGSISAVASILWIVVLQHRQRESRGADVPSSLAFLTAVEDVRPRDAWRSPTAWNLAVLFGLTSANVFILFTWLPTIITETGAEHAAGFGGGMVAVLIAVSMLIGIFAPTLTIRMRNPMPLVEACVALFAVGYAGIAIAPDTLPVLWVVFLGAGSSLFIIAQTMINTHSRTPAGSAVMSGFVQGMGGAIAVIGSLLFGAVHVWTHSWSEPYAVVAAALAGIAVTGYLERRHHVIEDDLQRIRSNLEPAEVSNR